MPGPLTENLQTSPANGGLIRRGYVFSTIVASASLFVVGLLLPSRPWAHLPAIGSMLMCLGSGAGLTGLLFGFRLTNPVARIVRCTIWGLALAVGVILAFGMGVSENLGVSIVLMLGSAYKDVAVPLLISRTSAALALLTIGSLAAFLWSTLLELKKYHTFLCIRLMRVRMINYLVILAVAGSVFVLIVVLSVLWGFDRDLRSRIRGTLAAVSIEARGNDRVQDYDTVIDWIEEDKGLAEHVTACAPYVQTFGFLESRPRESQVYTVSAIIRGIDMERERRVGDIESYLQDGKRPDFLLDGAKPPHPGIIIGRELAGNIELLDNDQLLTGTEIQLNPPLSTGFINRPTFTLVGTFKTGYLEYDSRFVYIPIREAQQLAGYDFTEATGISVALKDHNTADKVKEALVGKLTPKSGGPPIYSVKTWAEQRGTLLAAIHFERVMMTIILGSLVALSGLFVCAVMLMAVKEKTRDIGIVKAIGGTVTGIMEIFLINGLVIGTVGAALGGVAGLLVVRHINAVAKFLGLRVFPPEIYYLDKIPTYLDFVGVAMILCSAVAVSLLAAMVPSLIAARLSPMEALRYE
jgi:lipoprotein-releasing system permease protein